MILLLMKKKSIAKPLLISNFLVIGFIHLLHTFNGLPCEVLHTLQGILHGLPRDETIRIIRGSCEALKGEAKELFFFIPSRSIETRNQKVYVLRLKNLSNINYSSTIEYIIKE